MLLEYIIEELDFELLQGSLQQEISSISFDSREIIQGSMFVAVSGFVVDGHRFIQSAIDKGATAVIVEKEVSIPTHVTVLKVADSRLALARVASNFCRRPSHKLNLIGITGTNGKTSISYLIKSILDHTGISIGLIGTMGTLIDEKQLINQNTTPESLHLQHIFAEMSEYGTEHCIMEVSSHALSLNRVAFTDFNIGIFTNLTPDHLELHGSMEEYFQAKSLLFSMTKDYNIINVDDNYGRRLAAQVDQASAVLITYGIDHSADVYASDIQLFSNSSRFTVHTSLGSIEMNLNMPGKIFIYNCLAAVACAICNHISLENIKAGVEQVQAIKGRLEVVYQKDDFKVVVDFAHTEDALQKALSTLRPFVKGRLIVVFGVYAAPGEQGVDKRRAMGHIAARYADFAVVTSDNPKNQDPDLIIQDIIKAMDEAEGDYEAIVDRKEAIQFAIEMSAPEDTILIAGKGHETTQIIGTTEIPFIEKDIVHAVIKKSSEL